MSRFAKKHDAVSTSTVSSVTRQNMQHKSPNGISIIMPVEHGELPVAHEFYRHEHHPYPPSDIRYKSLNDQNVTIVETHKYYESESDLAPRHVRAQPSSSHDEQLLADNRRLREELEEHLRQLEKMRHDTQSLSHKVDHLTKEREKIDSDHDTEIRELKKRVKDLEAIRSDLESKLKQNDHQNNSLNESLERDLERLQEELDRRTDEMEQMRADHQRALSKMVSIDREKSLLRQIDNFATKATDHKHCIEARTAEIETLKTTHIPIHRESELLEKIRKLSAALMEKESEINQLHLVVEDKHRLQLEVDRLRHECDRLRNEHAHTNTKCTCAEDIIKPLKDLIREQESHIADLRREIESLKKKECHCGNLKKEASEVKSMVFEDTFPVSDGCPKCIAEEKSRLLGGHQKASFSTQTIVNNSKELDEATKNLNASRMRIKQLEQWLSQVYTDHNFEATASAKPKQYAPILPSVDYRIKPDKYKYQYTKKPITNLTGNFTGLLTDRHANCSDNCVHHRKRHLSQFP